MTNYLAALAAALLLGATQAHGASPFVAPRTAAVPGGVVTLRLPGAPDAPPAVSYSGKPVLVARQNDAWLAIVGISLDTVPGDYQVSILQPGASETTCPSRSSTSSTPCNSSRYRPTR